MNKKRATTKTLCMVLAVLILNVYPRGVQAQEVVIDLADPPSSVPILRIYGDDEGDRLGSFRSQGIGFGQINGDACDDLIAGADRADTAAGEDAGEVYVLYGDVSLASGTIDLNTNGAISSIGETRILGEWPSGRLGKSVCSGDVDGDGFDDVIIGAHGPNIQGGSGAVYVVYGSAALPATLIDLSSPPPSVSVTRIYHGLDSAFGRAVASGDFDADGYDDIIAGAPNIFDETGEVYIIWGAGLRASPPMIINPNQGFTFGTTRIIADPSSDAARLGFSVAAGDMNADGYADMIMGAPGADPNGVEDAGEFWVLFGGEIVPNAIVTLGVTGGKVVTGNEKIPRVGIHKIRGMGTFQLALVAYAITFFLLYSGFGMVSTGAVKDKDPQTQKTTGSAYVIPTEQFQGDIQTHVFTLDSYNQFNISRFVGKEEDDYLGSCVSIYQRNKFWKAMLSAPKSDPLGRDGAGEVYLYQDFQPGLIRLLDTPSSTLLIGPEAGAKLGASFALGADLNGDGQPDVGTTLPYLDNSLADPVIPNTGGLAVYFGSKQQDDDDFIIGSRYYKPGFAPWGGIGGRLSAEFGLWLKYGDGDDGQGGVSQATTRRYFDHSLIQGLGNGTKTDVYNGFWYVDPDRENFTLTPRLRLHYDIGDGLNASRLAVYESQQPTGPWNPVPGFSHDQMRQQFEFNFPTEMVGPRYFALAEDMQLPRTDYYFLGGSLWYEDALNSLGIPEAEQLDQNGDNAFDQEDLYLRFQIKF